MKRSDGRSAVAASAYLSGSRLFSEYQQRWQDYSHKPGIVHAELLLPKRAPPEFSFRAALWNSVEKEEKQWNSQLARRIIMALPRELSQEDNIRLVRQYCQGQFVDKGMCCDFAIHDDGDGNPHAHILLTMRALDEHGKWLPKSRKVYDLDENGERIRLPSGNWKSHKENTVDWNDQSKAEVWRHEWEVLQNQYLEAAGRSERVDLRSYERQGVELAPTVHMGPAITNLERRGVRTIIGDLNRDIVRENKLLQTIQEWLNDLLEQAAALIQRLSQPENVTIKRLLYNAAGLRESEREGWDASTRTKLNASVRDWNHIQDLIDQMDYWGILTPVDLKNDLERMQQVTVNVKHNIAVREERIRQAQVAQHYLKYQKDNDAVFRKYSNTFFKKSKENYYQQHKATIDNYRRAQVFFDKHPELRNSVKLSEYLDDLQSVNVRDEKSLSEIERTIKAEAQVLRLINIALPEGEQITIQPAVKPTSKGLIRVNPEPKQTEKPRQTELPKAEQKEPAPAKPEKKSIRKRLQQAEQARREEHQQQNERGKQYEPNHSKKSYEQDL